MHDADTRALIADLQAQIDELRGSVGGPRAASRRQLLKVAGAAAAGTIGAALAPTQAAAETGYAVDPETDVVDAVNQRLLGPPPGTSSFVFTSGAGAPDVNTSDAPSVLAGWAFDAGVPDGVAGATSVPGGIGVHGSATADGAIGGSFSGSAGALQLVATQAAAPPVRGTAHELGVLETDTAGNLWFCAAAGTPGTWRKLAGPQSAGTFHPLPPGRVYDSRRAEPLRGTLTGGQNRTISVADRRSTDEGAVVQADFVPPGAVAVAANVTIVTVAAGGFLVCNPGGDTAVNASTINWSAPGQVLANGVILTLDATRQLTIVAGGGTTHFLIDVTGYWL